MSLTKTLIAQLDSILAAISMYTRLPAWRLKTLSAESYAQAINALPLVSVITGGCMALTFYLAYSVLHLGVQVSVILSLISRLLLTGAFHEDGLGDFFDGFGGGRDRESILRIMKDSHVGSYAVIAFILYYLLLNSLLVSIDPTDIPWVLLLGDCMGKLSVLGLVNTLPYARTEEDSKIKLVYTTHKYHIAPLLTFALILYVGQYLLSWHVSFLLLAVLFCAVLYIRYVKSRLVAYTGDTCGAMILFIELLTILFLYIDLKE